MANPTAAVESEVNSDGTACIRIHRPEAKNALNQQVREALAERFDAFAHDPDVRAVVLTGGDEFFVAGADIKEFATASAMEMYSRHAEYLWRAIAAFPKPVIAAVNGFALGGGCELAMHADIIIAGESARFGQPEVRLGLMPGAGGTQRLVRAVGKFNAMRMLLTGSPISAADALRMGLASEVVADSDTLSRAQALASKLAALPPVAVAQIKEVVLAGADLPLDSALTLERKAFQLLFDTQDQKEGATAFFEKRSPVFEGK
ncbi:enoyl-CoA hydratase [Carnimonas bestiolae]|uniref:enoyl-CoA hydratase n=1 Tax=Carnimonas bestiolae TaxID=3402172 RepID=UPI003EDBBC12